MSSHQHLWPPLPPFYHSDFFMLHANTKNAIVFGFYLCPLLLLYQNGCSSMLKTVSLDLSCFLKRHLQVLKIDTASAAPFPAVLLLVAFVTISHILGFICIIFVSHWKLNSMKEEFLSFVLPSWLLRLPLLMIPLENLRNLQELGCVHT